LCRKSLGAGDASTGDITRAQGNDLGLRYAGETEHHPAKQASEQKKPNLGDHLGASLPGIKTGLGPDSLSVAQIFEQKD
jgi:hypothetical protein